MKYAELPWNYDEEKQEEYIKDLAPIILFTYKRIDVLKKTIEALKNNVYADSSILYVFSDAPKGENDRTMVEEVRKYLHSIDGFKKIKIIERKKNYGLANNIISGVTKIVDRYGKVIVLEDDIVTSKFFLQYMNDALKIYENNEKVMEISGFAYPIKKNNYPETAFLHFADCWGWGTWKRSWDLFERNPKKLISEFSIKDIYHFNLEDGFDQWGQVVQNYQGKLYTWAVFWAACIYKAKGLMLYPYKSLVTNVGFDGSGEHGETDREYNFILADTPVKCFPVEIKEDSVLRGKLTESLRKTEHNILIKRIIVWGRNIIYKGMSQFWNNKVNKA